MNESVFLKALQLATNEDCPVSPDLAKEILQAPNALMPELLAAASRLKRRHFGDKMFCCSILNARSGACSEDCAFCAQSAHHDTGVPVYDLMGHDQILASYLQSAKLPICHFGVVTSGTCVDEAGLASLCETIRSRKLNEVAWCASLGDLSLEALKKLKAAGLRRFHHNLETARSFFPKICTTHTYDERLNTLKAVREAGLEICSGGILGMGESHEQRVEFALTLQAEQVDSIPMNFLVPVPGTRLGGLDPMKPLDILRSIVMFRCTNPRAEIKVCAGRLHLHDLQSMIFYAGATGMMVGPLLTVAGRSVPADLQMLKDLELPHEERTVD